jgi:exopolysaccharide biosynthesis polyprenyl glycosylphosphotransferase
MVDVNRTWCVWKDEAGQGTVQSVDATDPSPDGDDVDDVPSRNRCERPLVEAGTRLAPEPTPNLERRRSRFVRFAPALPAAIQDAARARSTVEARDRLYRRMLACADVLAAAVTVVLCVTVLGDDRLTAASFLALPLIVVVSKLQGLYDRDELLIRKGTIDEAPALLHLATLYTFLFWLGDAVFVAGSLGKAQVLVGWAALVIAMLTARHFARSLARRLSARERILFVGDAAAFSRFNAKLGHDGVNAEVVARMSLERAGGARRSSEGELNELLEWADVHRVVIEPQVLPPDEMLDFVRAAKAVGIRVSLLPRVFDVIGTSVVFDELQGMTVLGVRRFGLPRSSMLVKRTFDLAGALVVLVAFAPLMAAIATAIKLDSPGPVLFRQTRVGRGGRRFRICKFRTMSADAERRKAELVRLNEAGGGLFKMADDPRVTRVGRLLRKTSLDELPQLFNVLAGDMSLVGPRPLVVDEDELVTGWDRRRLSLTPGMTGHWQILGSARIPLQEMVKIDYLYVAGWSLWSDLKILLRTVPYVLRRRGQ